MTVYTENRTDPVLGLDDAGLATRTPDMPEYDLEDLDEGFNKYVADAKALMCSETCPAGVRQAKRSSDGAIVRLDASGKLGIRDGSTITTYFRPTDPDAYFAKESQR